MLAEGTEGEIKREQSRKICNIGRKCIELICIKQSHIDKTRQRNKIRQKYNNNTLTPS
jgi:hypothetical protein